MKAVVYAKRQRVEVRDVENPRIEDARDCIVRVSSTAICGSDLHMYDGRTDIAEGLVFGHEIMGSIEECGSAVTSLKRGDRVVLPFNIACGSCFNCSRGYTNACLTLNPESVGAAYGYADMGPYRGGQAQYVRVPFADFNCLKVPGTPGDTFEKDFLMLADIFPTGYHGTALANVEPGSTVAIYGAGPVGLLAAMSALIRGASEVYVVDQSSERLALAEKIGATPINFQDGNPVEQIRAKRRGSELLQGVLRPGEEKMQGVMCGIDAVGYQALALDDSEDEQPGIVIEQLVELVNPTGSIGIVGVYMPEDQGAHTDLAKLGKFALPLGKIFSKGLTIGAGQTPVKKYNRFLLDLIITGKAKPGIIISHEMAIDDAPKGYTFFDMRGMEEGAAYTKIVLKPHS